MSGTANRRQVARPDGTSSSGEQRASREAAIEEPASTGSGVDRESLAIDLAGVNRLSQRDTLEKWGAAMARGDDLEVDRLVRKSHVDRAGGGAFPGLLEALLGRSAEPFEPPSVDPFEIPGVAADPTGGPVDGGFGSMESTPR